MDTAQPPKVRYNPQFKQEVDIYIEECQKNKITPTVKGFAQRIGTDEDSILAWANRKKRDKITGELTDQLARPQFLAQIKKLQKLPVIKEEKSKGENREGRPLKFKSVEELKKKIDEYFKSCWVQKVDMFGNPIFLKDDKGKKTNQKVMIQFRPYTITGIAVALDTTRDLLIDYAEKDEFSDTIKRAKQMCHNYAEESLFIGKNPTGAIFNLKNNYGWQDKTETEHSGSVIWKEEEPK